MLIILTVFEALLLLIGLAAITYGVRLFSVPAGFVVGGTLLIVFAALLNKGHDGPAA